MRLLEKIKGWFYGRRDDEYLDDDNDFDSGTLLGFIKPGETIDKTDDTAKTDLK